MNRALLRRLAVLCLLVVATEPCWGQFFRPPVVRAPIFHPVVGPHRSSSGGDDDGTFWYWLAGGVAAVIGIALIVRWLRSGSHGTIRIRAVPPGEAPEWVRRAWVGMDLPLVTGQMLPTNLEAQQVISGRPHASLGYAVDSRTAVRLLESVNAQAAAWWRQCAPHILQRGGQLVFPLDVCDRLNDLGIALAPKDDEAVAQVCTTAGTGLGMDGKDGVVFRDESYPLFSQREH